MAYVSLIVLILTHLGAWEPQHCLAIEVKEYRTARVGGWGSQASEVCFHYRCVFVNVVFQAMDESLVNDAFDDPSAGPHDVKRLLNAS